MVRYCQICDFPMPEGYCPKHGALVGPADVKRDETTVKEDTAAVQERRPRSSSESHYETGSFHPDMTKMKARRKFQQHMKHQQPLIVNLDRDLQEQYVQQAMESAGIALPNRPVMALEEGGNYCGGCGFLQEDDDNFCPKCGRPRKRGSGTNPSHGGGGLGDDDGENLFSQT